MAHASEARDGVSLRRIGHPGERRVSRLGRSMKRGGEYRAGCRSAESLRGDRRCGSARALLRTSLRDAPNDVPPLPLAIYVTWDPLERCFSWASLPLRRSSLRLPLTVPRPAVSRTMGGSTSFFRGGQVFIARGAFTAVVGC